MQHFQDEGHYQEQMNANAKADMDAQMHQMEGEAEAHEKESMTRELGERELTFGEKLVGLTFNPSGDNKVQRAKELCAELADLLNEHNTSQASNQFTQRLFSHAVGEILNAQMNVVKVLTLKY